MDKKHLALVFGLIFFVCGVSSTFCSSSPACQGEKPQERQVYALTSKEEFEDFKSNAFDLLSQYELFSTRSKGFVVFVRSIVNGRREFSENKLNDLATGIESIRKHTKRILQNNF